MDRTQILVVIKKIFSILYTLNLGFLIRWTMYLDFNTLQTPYFRQAATFLHNKGERNMETFIEKHIETLITRKNIKDNKQEYNKPGIQESLFAESMRIFFKVTNDAGFRPFLAFGSLLGFVREGRFIEWDKDLDICFLYQETDVARLEKLLKDTGFKLIVNCGKKIPFKIKCRLNRKHPPIDIAFFVKEADKLLTYGRVADSYVVRHRTPFSLVEKEYYGVKIRIPQNPEVFLTENYGDWQTPRRIHHWILDSKLTDFNLPHVQFLAKEYFLNCLNKNDTLRIEHYLNLFSERLGNDTFWKKINTEYGKSRLH